MSKPILHPPTTPIEIRVEGPKGLHQSAITLSEGITGITDAQYEDIKRILLKKTRLRLLIEFSRAVHAVMDAIIAVARGAILGVGSTMYATTYQLISHVNYIIDVGLKRVVFIEPYGAWPSRVGCVKSAPTHTHQVKRKPWLSKDLRLALLRNFLEIY